jgi:AhpD family alkylhydroperoxidase
MNFMQRLRAGPALVFREEELINVGIAVAAQCQWCIAVDVKYAIAAGA